MAAADDIENAGGCSRTSPLDTYAVMQEVDAISLLATTMRLTFVAGCPGWIFLRQALSFITSLGRTPEAAAHAKWKVRQAVLLADELPDLKSMLRQVERNIRDQFVLRVALDSTPGDRASFVSRSDSAHLFLAEILHEEDVLREKSRVMHSHATIIGKITPNAFPSNGKVDDQLRGRRMRREPKAASSQSREEPWRLHVRSVDPEDLLARMYTDQMVVEMVDRLLGESFPSPASEG